MDQGGHEKRGREQGGLGNVGPGILAFVDGPDAQPADGDGRGIAAEGYGQGQDSVGDVHQFGRPSVQSNMVLSSSQG